MGVEDVFPNGTRVVWLTSADGQERAAIIRLVFPRPLPLAEARRLAQAVQPRDARPVRRFTGDFGAVVELYRSDALATVFAGSSWFDTEPPGTLFQIAQHTGGEATTSFVSLGLGND
jgi:hypothetical protein